MILKNILQNNNHINNIAFNRDITPFSKIREKIITKLSIKYKINTIIGDDYSLLDINSIKTGKGTYYKTFYHYYNKVISRSNEITNSIKNPINITYCKLTNIKYTIKLSEIDKYRNKYLLIKYCSRDNALKILNNLKTFNNYDENRNQPSKMTTLLSVYLKYGTISIRETYVKILKC